MFSNKRLTEIYKNTDTPEISFDDSSKIILMSDCHRGDNSWNDNFARHSNVYKYALNYYYQNGFSYIELGDGDDLWENSNFSAIREAHSDVYQLLQKFHLENRLHIIFGNHDLKWKDQKKVKKNLWQYFDKRTNQIKPLFEGISISEGLILRHKVNQISLFLVHGHQVQLMYKYFWWLVQFLNRHFWKYLELAGMNDYTSPAKNYKVQKKVDEIISEWARANQQIVVSGHTHRPIFPDPGTSLLFNTGSCVHPRCITGIEIEGGRIVLIKWFIGVEDDGLMRIERKELVGAVHLKKYFSARNNPAIIDNH